jgi:hypothetical protein
MPTSQHEILIGMFRHRPGFAADLLKGTFEFKLPEYGQVTLGSTDLPDLRPTEYRADAVVVFAGADSPVLAVVVEAQRSRDDVKQFSWPVYLATLRARLKCPAVLLTVSTTASVAKWCGSPIRLGHPGWILTPLALGPDRVPVITDVEEALRSPEMTVLSVISHPAETDTFEALTSALGTFDRDHVALYADLVFAALPAALRHDLEDTMTTHPYLSDFAGNYYLRGEAEGKAEGETAGKLEATAVAVLAVLEARGLEISEAVRNKIDVSEDLDELSLWLRRAVVAGSVDDLFDEAPGGSTPN